jgi:hypothetical protein
VSTLYGREGGGEWLQAMNGSKGKWLRGPRRRAHAPASYGRERAVGGGGRGVSAGGDGQRDGGAGGGQPALTAAAPGLAARGRRGGRGRHDSRVAAPFAPARARGSPAPPTSASLSARRPLTPPPPAVDNVDFLQMQLTLPLTRGGRSRCTRCCSASAGGPHARPPPAEPACSTPRPSPRYSGTLPPRPRRRATRCAKCRGAGRGAEAARRGQRGGGAHTPPRADARAGVIPPPPPPSC